MKNIPLCIPNFEGNEKKYVDKAVKEGWVSTGGAYILELENKMAEFLGVKDVVALQSGTAAIHLALIDAGVMPGTAVFVPTLTFIAAVNPVKYQFAEPIFVDCDDYLTMDPVKLQKYIDEECSFKKGHLVAEKTGNIITAMVVVHVFGNMANMEALMDIAKKYNLKVIEDATEALGTRYTEGRYKGRYAGTIGDYGCYSFNGNKIITTGGGGALTARDPKRAAHIKYLSTQAKDDPLFYIHDEVGYNYRMTNVQAALGVAQLEELPEFIKRKNNNYKRYEALFKNEKSLKLIKHREGTESNAWFYALVMDMNNIKMNVKEVVNNLNEKGVGTRAVWGLISDQRPYRASEKTDLSRARYFSDRIINIPCSTQITEEEIDYSADTIMKLVASYTH